MMQKTSVVPVEYDHECPRLCESVAAQVSTGEADKEMERLRPLCCTKKKRVSTLGKKHAILQKKNQSSLSVSFPCNSLKEY